MFRLGIPREAQHMNYEPFPMIQYSMNLLEYTDFRITCELYGRLQLTEISSFILISILSPCLLHKAGQTSYKFESQYISKDYMDFKICFEHIFNIFSPLQVESK